MDANRGADGPSDTEAGANGVASPETSVPSAQPVGSGKGGQPGKGSATKTASPASSANGTHAASGSRVGRPTHTQVSCERCRQRKTRCGGDGKSPCPFCAARDVECVYPDARIKTRKPGAGSASTVTASHDSTSSNTTASSTRRASGSRRSPGPISPTTPSTGRDSPTFADRDPDDLDAASTLSSLASALVGLPDVVAPALTQIAQLYPAIPSALIPPLETVTVLLQYHLASRPVGLTFMHVPTLLDRIAVGQANPALLLTLIWSGLSLAPRTPNGLRDVPPKPVNIDETVLEENVWRLLREETERLAMAADSGEQVEPATVVPVLQALFVARTVAIARGPLSVLVEATLAIEELIPLARLGKLPMDMLPRSTVREAWIAAEERSRLCSLNMFGEVTRAAASNLVPLALPVNSIIGEQPHLNCALEVSDPVPTDIASIQLISFREVLSWVDTPRSNPRRLTLLKIGTAGTSSIVGTDLWARCLHFRKMCRQRGVEPYGEQVEQERNHIEEALNDWLDNLPEGRRREDYEAAPHMTRFRLALIFGIFAHLIPLLLYSPLDPISDIESATPIWPSQPSFRSTLTHGQKLAALIADLLTPPTQLDPSFPGWTKQAYSVELAKMVVPLFGLACGRAGWALLSGARNSSTGAQEIRRLGVALDGAAGESIGWKALSEQYSTMRLGLERVEGGEIGKGGKLFEGMEFARLGSWYEK